MSVGNQLVSEFRRAGKKSLVLAALFAVGLCIWLPMLWKSVFRRNAATKVKAASTAVAKTGSPAGTSPTTLGDTPQVDWKRVYRRVEKSSLVQPLALDELVRDPFDREWIREKNRPPTSKSGAELDADSDPNGFLVLSGTLAGDGGAAIISDYVYRVGQEVPKKGPIRFVLKDIRPDRVLLERAGTLFELRMKDLDQLSQDASEP
jgi:hypothetical protein